MKKIPRYFRMDTEVFLHAVEQKPRKSRELFNAFRKILFQLLEEKTSEFDKTTEEGRMLQRFEDTAKEGLSTYWKHIGALRPNGTPYGTPYGGTTKTKTKTKEETEKEKEETTETENNMKLTESDQQNLKDSGYTEDEIKKAVSEVKDWGKVKSKVGYIRAIIENNKTDKTVIAQNYSQREYDDGFVTEESDKRLFELAEEAKNGK